MSDASTPPTARREKITVDIRIEAEPHYSATRCFHAHKTNDEQIACRVAKAEKWAREFMDFLRDHRSQDLVGLDVVRVTEDRCSACGERWETMTDEGVEVCAYCAVAVAR